VYFALGAASTRGSDSRRSGLRHHLVALSRSPPIDLILCGLSLGVALTVDYVTAILLPIFLVYVAVSRRRSIGQRIQGILTVLASWGVGLLFLLYYNYSSFGNALTTSEQLYLGRSGLLGSFSFPLPTGLLLNFFTPLRGVLLYSPILAAGAWGLFVCLRRGKPSFAAINNWRLSLVFILALFIGIIVPYSMWYSATAGISYGPRFLIPAMPLILIPFGAAIGGGCGDMVAGRKKLVAFLAYGLFTIGVFVNGLGALTGAVPPDQAWLSSPFLHDVLPDLLKGQLDTWWKTLLGHYWPALGGLMLVIPLVSAGCFLRGMLGATPITDSRFALAHLKARGETRLGRHDSKPAKKER